MDYHDFLNKFHPISRNDYELLAARLTTFTAKRNDLIVSEGDITRAAEAIEHFTSEKVNIAGASFGGLICLKLALTNPDQIEKIFLLNPGCFQPFSLSLKNLYYNLLPIISSSEKNVKLFLNKAVFPGT